jgi:hypothetical protein
MRVRDDAARLRELYPNMRLAPPRPCRADATFDPCNAAGGFRPAARTSWLSRPDPAHEMIAVRAHGACLAPLLQVPHIKLFDWTQRADDHDVVLVQLRAEFLQKQWDGATQEWRERYAPDGALSNVCIKVLRHGKGKLWATNKAQATELNSAGTILGTLRHVELLG